jgi:hypothetical protein
LDVLIPFMANVKRSSEYTSSTLREHYGVPKHENRFRGQREASAVLGAS